MIDRFDDLRSLLTNTVERKSNPIREFVRDEMSDILEGNSKDKVFEELFIELSNQMKRFNLTTFSKDYIEQFLEDKYSTEKETDKKFSYFDFDMEVVCRESYERNKDRLTLDQIRSYLKTLDNYEESKLLNKSKIFNQSIRTKQRLIANFIRYLKDNYLVESKIGNRKFGSWTGVNSFRSYDYDSYEILMQRNGFSNYKFYKWHFNTEKRIVQRILIGTTKVRDSDRFYELLGQCDFFERKSGKSKARQGVRQVTGCLSWARTHRYQKVVTYSLIEGAKPNSVGNEFIDNLLQTIR